MDGSLDLEAIRALLANNKDENVVKALKLLNQHSQPANEDSVQQAVVTEENHQPPLQISEEIKEVQVGNSTPSNQSVSEGLHRVSGNTPTSKKIIRLLPEF